MIALTTSGKSNTQDLLEWLFNNPAPASSSSGSADGSAKKKADLEST